jgi:TatD DNase family protein
MKGGFRMFFDCHCHFDLVKEEERKNFLEKAEEKGIGKVISCSTSFESNKTNLELAKKFENVEAGIGLYPLNTLELNEKEIERAFEFFEKNIGKAKAIGEIGLDKKFTKREEEIEKQKRIFERFIDLGKKYEKPLIIHSRYAQRDVLEILEEKEARKVLLHGFTESEKLIKKAIEMNYFIGVGLIVLENELVKERVKKIPLEKILFETDCPIRIMGKKAYSEDIRKIAEKLAELKNLPLEKVEKQQEKNFIELFGKV